MQWLNLEIGRTIRAPEYAGSNPRKRATWINLVAYCCEQENGGRIHGARKWDERTWPQACGLFLEEINAESPMWWWDEDDLVVWNYPADKVAEVQAKRLAGAKGGKRSRKFPHGISHGVSTALSTASSCASSTDVSSPISCRITEGNGREGKGMERNSTGGDETVISSGNYEAADKLLDYLNELAGTDYRATHANLTLVAQRLAEVDNDAREVALMVKRQVRCWKEDPKMCAFLRPATLFDEEKFHSYFGQRHNPVSVRDPAQRQTQLRERIERHPANTKSLYHAGDKVTARQKAELQALRAELASMNKPEAA